MTEAFTGNVILKLYEGVAKSLLTRIKEGLYSTTRSKIGGILVKPALKKTLKTFDTSGYGGAPLLGLQGLVVKTHGNSRANEFCNTILQCVQFHEQDVNGKIRDHLLAAKADRIQEQNND